MTLALTQTGLAVLMFPLWVFWFGFSLDFLALFFLYCLCFYEL